MVTFYLMIIKGINTEHFEMVWLARFYLLHQNIHSLILTDQGGGLAVSLMLYQVIVIMVKKI